MRQNLGRISVVFPLFFSSYEILSFVWQASDVNELLDVLLASVNWSQWWAECDHSDTLSGLHPTGSVPPVFLLHCFIFFFLPLYLMYTIVITIVLPSSLPMEQLKTTYIEVGGAVQSNGSSYLSPISFQIVKFCALRRSRSLLFMIWQCSQMGLRIWVRSVSRL